MAQLRQDLSEFQELDTEIIIVGPENAKSFQKFFMEHNLPLTGLPDPSYRVLKLYGQEVNLFKLGRMPAMAIIDKLGITRFVHYGHAMSDIPPNQEVLTILEDLSSP